MQMPNAFDATNPPFDRLTSQEVETLRAALDIAYFRPGETIIAQNAPANALFVVIKGTIEERDGSDLLALLGPKDSFDSRALVHGKSGHAFVAREETLCYVAPKSVTLGLIQSNPRFASFFYREISQKLDELVRDEEERRYGSLMRARVAELFLHPPVFIDASDTIEAAGHLMREINSNALFVRDGERIGIITGMNLSKAVVLRRQSIETPVRELAHFDVVTLRPDDFVSSALLLMTKHNKRRVAVHDGERYVGILEDIDLLGFLAGSAQVVAGRIDRASSKEDLDDCRARNRGAGAHPAPPGRQGRGRSARSSPTSMGACSPGCSRWSRPPRSGPAAASSSWAAKAAVSRPCALIRTTD